MKFKIIVSLCLRRDHVQAHLGPLFLIFTFLCHVYSYLSFVTISAKFKKKKKRLKVISQPSDWWFNAAVMLDKQSEPQCLCLSSKLLCECLLVSVSLKKVTVEKVHTQIYKETFNIFIIFKLLQKRDDCARHEIQDISKALPKVFFRAKHI